MTTTSFLEDLKHSLICAFMNAPQIDARTSARVPVDLSVASDSARARVLQQQDGTYWASCPQLPVATCN